VYAIAALICLGGQFVSVSRGAWLGAAVAGAVLLVGRARQRPAGRLIILAACAAALVLLGLMLRGGGGSEQARLLLWSEAAGYLARHPLGIGLDQFYAYHLPDSGRSLIDPTLLGTSEQYAAHPHNLLLDIWLRMGPLGLLAFGWLTVRVLRRAWARGRGLAGEPLALGALAALAAALTHGLVDHFYFVPDLAIVFWSLVAYVGQAGLSRPAKSPALP
jgi:putative inorganic carbon (HCO3(-)) transporter